MFSLLSCLSLLYSHTSILEWECLYILEAYSLNFDSTGSHNWACLKSQRGLQTLKFQTVLRLLRLQVFLWSWTKYILYCEMAVSRWRSRAKCYLLNLKCPWQVCFECLVLGLWHYFESCGSFRRCDLTGGSKLEKLLRLRLWKFCLPLVPAWVLCVQAQCHVNKSRWGCSTMLSLLWWTDTLWARINPSLSCSCQIFYKSKK